MFPLRYCNIAKVQKDNLALQQKLASHDNYSIATFCGRNKAHSLMSQQQK
jgi:hypothetical protein